MSTKVSVCMCDKGAEEGKRREDVPIKFCKVPVWEREADLKISASSLLPPFNSISVTNFRIADG